MFDRLFKKKGKMKMKKKEKTIWEATSSGVTFRIAFTLHEIDRRTSSYESSEDTEPKFQEYILGMNLDMDITSDIQSELDGSFEVFVEFEHFIADSESGRTQNTDFDGEYENISLFLTAPEDYKTNKEKFKVSFRYESTVIISQMFEISSDGTITECEEDENFQGEHC